MHSEPHKIVVRVYLGHSACRFADVHWNEETRVALAECMKRDGVYYACFRSAEEVCRRNEIRGTR